MSEGITSLKSFVDGLAAVDITGVKMKLTEPPASLPSGRLPASWPMLPVETEEGPLTFEGGGGWPTLRAELWVAVTPVSTGTQETNWSEVVEMCDNVAVALRGADLTKSKLSWKLRVQVVSRGEHEYWAVVATVEGHG